MPPGRPADSLGALFLPPCVSVEILLKESGDEGTKVWCLIDKLSFLCYNNLKKGGGTMAAEFDDSMKQTDQMIAKINKCYSEVINKIITLITVRLIVI